MYSKSKCTVILSLKIALLVALADIVAAQDIFEPPFDRAQFSASLQSGNIIVNGELDEPIWQQAVVFSDFVQKEPLQQATPTYRTEVRLAYDEEALYVGVICFQPSDKIRVQNLQRDFPVEENDMFGISIDGFLDKRTAVVFQTTPFGNQRDLEVIDALDVNLDWDARWTVRTKIHEDRWVAEMEIPWRILRYREGADRLGVLFARSVRSSGSSSGCSG